MDERRKGEEEVERRRTGVLLASVRRAVGTEKNGMPPHRCTRGREERRRKGVKKGEALQKEPLRKGEDEEDREQRKIIPIRHQKKKKREREKKSLKSIGEVQK